MRNTLGIEIKVGHWIMGRDFEGRLVEGRVKSFRKGPHYMRIMLDTGDEVAFDEVIESLGPMTVGPGGVVTQNPLTRVRLNSPSMATGEAPSARLRKRRRKTAKAPKGVYANPLVRVRVNSPSMATGEAPSKRLVKRRKATKKAPAGYYANPLPFEVVRNGGALLGAFPTAARAREFGQAWADANDCPCEVKDRRK